MRKVCFICEGNTCRSPMAEKIFSMLAKDKKQKIKVESYGLNAQDGVQMSIQAKRALKKLNINVGTKKSKKLEHLESNCLYVTMDSRLKQFINYKNVFSFSELVGGDDVVDPYGQSQDVYDYTAKQLYVYCAKLLEKLTAL